MELIFDFHTIGVVLSTFIITLLIFQFLDQLVLEMKRRNWFLRIGFAAANAAVAVCGFAVHQGKVSSFAAILILVLDVGYVLEYTIMSKDDPMTYLFFGSSVFFNNFMPYVLVYAVFRFIPAGVILSALYQKEVFIIANVIGIGILLLYRLPVFPTKEIKHLVHSAEKWLLNIWFPIVSGITFFNTMLILPAMEGAWVHQSEWMERGREIAFYVIIAEWAILLMSSSYLVVFYQAGRIRLREKFLTAKEQADCQPLTGLLNRRGWKRKVERMLESGEKGYLVMIDLDHFKEINDNFGHIKGDRILKETADMLRLTFRKVDVIGHIGGDEFCVFVAGDFEKEIVDQRLEQLMDMRRKEFSSKDGKTFCLSLSAGYAAVPESKVSLKELISAADAALYWQKEHGRDGFTMFREEMFY